MDDINMNLYDDIEETNNVYNEDDADFENENEEDEYDGGNTVIDNTGYEYINKEICITLDSYDRAVESLRRCEKELCRKFPKIQELPDDDRLQMIVENVFTDGFVKLTFVRNLSFTNNMGQDRPVLAIRPEILPNDFLSNILDPGCTLLFKGYIRGREFVINEIYDTLDTEQLPFETVCELSPRNDPRDVRGGNFFIEVLKDTESLTRYTEERLTEWEDYLSWKEALSRQQIVGVKYFKCDVDAVKRRLYFWLVCPDEAYFGRIRKYLSRDMLVFENNYSSDKWIFNLADSDRNIRYKSVELGQRCRVVEKYYPKNDVYSSEQDAPDDEEEIHSEKNDEDNAHIITERELFKHFEHPFVVKVSYELNQSDKDDMEMLDFGSVEETEEYLRENVLTQYFPSGFLALSAVGDFALIRRFRRAIRELSRNNISYSPNLAVWLFNITQARLPVYNQSTVIDEWLNPDIAGNENQRTAVIKMLAAPDVCLIQGPPGTGKTTVIAEGIYQFVKKGCRVLVASQSNDAVDNALERLSDSPVIRAVRLGQKSRKKRGLEMGAEQYFADSVLKHYYGALSSHISKQWLDRWNHAAGLMTECDYDKRDITLYAEEAERLNRQYMELHSEIQDLRREEQTAAEELDAINSENANIRNEKHQLSVFLDHINNKNKADIPFYLSGRQLRLVEEVINPVIASARDVGIYLTLSELDKKQGSDNECEYLRIFLSRTDILRGLTAKTARRADNDTQDQNTMELLQHQADQLKNNMADAFSEGDMDKAGELREQLGEVKEKINRLRGLGHVLDISAAEKGILSDKLYGELVSSSDEAVQRELQRISKESAEAVEDLCRRLSELTDSLQPVGTAELVEKQKAVNGKLSAKKSEAAELSKLISLKQNTLPRLAEKYGAASATHEAVADAIAERRRQCKDFLDRQQEVRNEWQSVMQGFCQRLGDTELLEYDQHFFQRIYMESCNVVGISCTDNMKVLSDYGLEYFDVVIIDEVSKATPPELLIPLMRARKAVIVGDHRQLPPMFKEHENSYAELLSDRDNIPEELQELITEENFPRFRKMVTSSLFKEYFEKADDSIKHSLLTQYRMHSDIMDVINRFYELRLQNGLSAEQEEAGKAHGMTVGGVDGSRFIVPERHAYWIDSSSLPDGRELYDSRGNRKTEHGGGTSVYNVFEKWIVIQLLKMLADGWRENYKENKQKKTVGVISFYQFQVNLIRDAFKSERRKFDFSPLDIDINTVDRFQGKEKNVVITSLVRNNPQRRASKHVVTFERINVAFSRAQEMLLIVGAKKMYEKQKVTLPNMDREGTVTTAVYENIINELRRKGTFAGSEKVILPEAVQLIIKEYEGDDED